MEIMQKQKKSFNSLIWCLFKGEQMHPPSLTGISIWLKHLGLNNPSDAPRVGDISCSMSRASRLLRLDLVFLQDIKDRATDRQQDRN